MNLCEAFKKISRNTWTLMERAHAQKYAIKEESVTDLNLINLGRLCPKHVITRTYTRHEEASSGADWEWWVTDSGAEWVCFRVQAKVLDRKGIEFKQLDYKSGKQGRVLVEEASKSGAVPLYLLYLKWSLRAQDVWESKPIGYTGVKSRFLYGCSLLPADAMKDKDLIVLMPQLQPLHYLVCPPTNTASSTMSLVESLTAYWNNARGITPSWTETIGIDNEIPLNLQVFSREELPRYVSNIIASRYLRTDREVDVEPAARQLEGVVVFSQRPISELQVAS